MSEVIPNNEFSIINIFKRFKKKISITFLLLTLENIFNVLIPFFLGIAINDLIESSYTGVLYFTSIYLLKFVIDVTRRVYDTRAFSSIYVEVADETVDSQIKKNASESQTVSRANLIEEVIDFFEQELVQGFSSLFSVVGSIIMLLIYDYRLFLGGVLSIVLIFLVYVFSEKRIYSFNKSMNDQLDKHVDIISAKKRGQIRSHFKKLAFWNIKLSDQESINFGIIELILFGLIIFTLAIAATTGNPTPGSIFAILSYVIEFAEGVFMLPFIYQQKIRLDEIVNRINS